MAEFDAQDMSPEQLLRQQIQQLQFTNQQLHQHAKQSQAQAQFFMGQQNQHFQINITMSNNLLLGLI